MSKPRIDTRVDATVRQANDKILFNQYNKIRKWSSREGYHLKHTLGMMFSDFIKTYIDKEE